MCVSFQYSCAGGNKWSDDKLEKIEPISFSTTQHATTKSNINCQQPQHRISNTCQRYGPTKNRNRHLVYEKWQHIESLSVIVFQLNYSTILDLLVNIIGPSNTQRTQKVTPPLRIFLVFQKWVISWHASLLVLNLEIAQRTECRVDHHVTVISVSLRLYTQHKNMW